MRQHLAVCMALLFALSLVAIPIGSAATVQATGTATPQEGDVATASTTLQSDGDVSDGGVVHTCAMDPPEDYADPAEDGLGWSNGYWYDEPLDVNTTGGLNESEFDALVARTEARVEAIRCLPFENETTVEVITREEFANETAQWNVSEDRRAFENVVYEALLLVDDTDVAEVRRENLETGVGGYYDPATDRIVVIADDEESLEFDETVLAHELGHALQDQQFDLSRFDEQMLDASTAENGLIEGDVGYVEQLYEGACEDGVWADTCIEVQDPEPAPGPDDLANVGLYLLSFQPYSDGPAFVDARYEYDPGEQSAGNWGPVNELYENPPGTTAEVISPDRYPSYKSTNVTIQDNSTDEWERLTVEGRPDYETVGQAGLFTMFANPTFDSAADQLIEPSELQDNDSPYRLYNYSNEYVTGWDGDRLQVYESEDGETGYVWATEWESEEDALAFRQGYDRLLDDAWSMDRVEGRAGTYESGDAFAGAYYVDREGTQVSIVHAPTVDQLSDLESTAESTTEWELPQSTPADDTGTGTDTGTDEIPGFGIVAAVIGLFGAFLIVLRRRRNGG
ncbi:Hvo_1808 family surface protein [Natronoarchaeum sp. GCM10025321]|uniref:Hvo_1808 family surface protein n=1 Tax=Natronoarchaeum sp. GCM10025321 TaxID=3252684 RepID=UPI003620AEA3